MISDQGNRANFTFQYIMLLQHLCCVKWNINEMQYHTWYLSQAPQAVPVEKNIPCGENFSTRQIVMWRNFPYDKSSVGEMSSHGRYGEIWRKICHVEKFLHMRDVETNLFCHNSCCFVVKSVLLPYTLFCCERYFVAIYALLCGEKFNQKIVPVEKNGQISGMITQWKLYSQNR